MTGNETIVFPEAEVVEIEARERPEPGPEEVLVETRRSLVSTGTELALLTGAYQRGTFPFVPGYSNVGRVVAVGDAVGDDVLGTRVATPTAHAAYVVAPREQCRPVPEDVSDEDAAFFRLAEIAMNGVRVGDVEWGESAVVFGLGLLGQLAVRICRLAGARPVIGVELAPERLSYLPELPGVIGVDGNEDDWTDRIADATDGRMADVVIEATGNADALSEESRALRKRGRLVVLGSPRDETRFDFYRNSHLPGTAIVGAHVTTHPSVATPENPWTEVRNGELFFDYLADGRIEVDSLISHRGPHTDASDSYETLVEERTRAMGVLFEWTD